MRVCRRCSLPQITSSSYPFFLLKASELRPNSARFTLIPCWGPNLWLPWNARGPPSHCNFGRTQMFARSLFECHSEHSLLSSCLFSSLCWEHNWFRVPHASRAHKFCLRTFRVPRRCRSWVAHEGQTANMPGRKIPWFSGCFRVFGDQVRDFETWAMTWAKVACILMSRWNALRFAVLVCATEILQILRHAFSAGGNDAVGETGLGWIGTVSTAWTRNSCYFDITSSATCTWTWCYGCSLLILCDLGMQLMLSLFYINTLQLAHATDAMFVRCSFSPQLAHAMMMMMMMMMVDAWWMMDDDDDNGEPDGDDRFFFF